MAKTRVYLLTANLLLSQGLEALLSDVEQMEVIGHETDAERGLARIKTLRPDVVLLDVSLALSGSAPALAHILTGQLGIRVIGLNQVDNTIHVYQGEERVITEVNDLLEAIQEHTNTPRLLV